MQQVSIEHCTSDPEQFKLCSEDSCVSRESICPCLEGEYRCFLGDCISLLDTCDGLPHCMYADDESDYICDNLLTEVSSNEQTSDEVTASNDGMSLPVIVTIASVCVFVTVLVVIFIGILIAKRQKNNTSRESQSASEPLRKSYITTYIESDVDSPTQKRRLTFPIRNNLASRDHASYLPVERFDHGLNEGAGGFVESESVPVGETETEPDTGKPNLAIQLGVEIYDVNALDSSRIRGLGKYTFKPRLKYLNSKPYNELDEKDRDKLYVINSYRHCSGKSILPSTLTFDKDPQQFSDKFATDLLCSSTPRPPLRGLTKTDLQEVSHESIPATVQAEGTQPDV